MKKYLEYLKSVKGRAENTVNGYETDLKQFENFMLDNFEVTELDAVLNAITIQDLHAYISYLDRKGKSNRTKARHIAAIKSYFKYLKGMKIIDDNPALELESPKLDKKLPIHLELEEAEQLLNVAIENKRDYCILTLFLNCGLRMSELVGINIEDIRGETLIVNGKGSKERTIYLNQSCIAALIDWLEIRKEVKDNALFLTNRDMRFTSKGIEYLIDKYLKLASLEGKGYTTHKLRHTAATLMYQNGVDILALKEILGHESVSTTQIYTHINNEQLKKAVENNPLNRRK